MATPSEFKDSKQAADTYNRVLGRLEGRIADMESHAWETVKQEIDDAIEFEYEVSELTREEMSLLGAYVKRDLKEMFHYLKETGAGVKSWFRQDLDLVEERVKKLLLGIADKTRVDQLELEQKLQHDAGDYIAGEIACAGMLKCLNCGYMMCLTETARIEPCHQCNEHYFHRLTSRWPHDPEVADPESE